ncbi:hypothetical protein C1645_844857 [Glomus cerebriforme]|uniref:Uncharacterized protein n=1 Tax=Glomus cerebriforme TaxID=658196 RepID=A0A397S2N7_9GLOM|nr:hypothetical protein C1645_844857 [Glomus cerebriforme]
MILARDSEVVAVNLKILLNKCRVYISKNSRWLNKDIRYIDEIKGLMKNLSKDSPIIFEQVAEKKDVFALFSNVLEYCSVKLGRRLNKLKKDIKDNKSKPHIKSFLEFLESYEINVDNLDEINELFGEEISKFEYLMTTACCEYYKDNKNNKNYLQRFLECIKKVGSYSAFVMDIVNCACKEKYKTSFSCIDLHLLDPIPNDQPISSWTDIIKKFISIQKRGYKKLYYRWKLPNTYSNEFVKYALCELDQIIENGIEQNTKIIAKSDSDGESPNSNNPKLNHITMKKMSERAFQIKTNSNL